jgi:hypothetical protein
MLDPAGQAALEGDIRELLARSDRGGGGLVVASEYLEVVVTRT